MNNSNLDRSQDIQAGSMENVTPITQEAQMSDAEAILRIRVTMENTLLLWQAGKIEAHVALKILNALETVR